MAVLVDYRKWPDRPHYRYDANVLGRDEHGTWLAVAAGTALYRDDRLVHGLAHPWLVLVPEDWWMATWPQDDDVEVYVDFCLPPAWRGDRLVVVDLDIDLIRHRDGRVDLLDLDEFEAAVEANAYLPAFNEQAGPTAARLRHLLADRAEPFGTAADPWLARLRSARPLAAAGVEVPRRRRPLRGRDRPA
jgi:uncharacterized protein